MTHTHMARAVELAHDVEGLTSPNPPVGAVLVRDGTIVGEGSTQPPGGAHAEIMAIRAAGVRAHGSVLYVTLEPCSHWGRTPPCVDALIRTGVLSVHAAVLDPNPAVQGEGVRRLRASGVEVILGECSSEASQLIKPHQWYSVEGRPFVTLFASGPDIALARVLRSVDVVLRDAELPFPALARAIEASSSGGHQGLLDVGKTAVIVSDIRATVLRASEGSLSLPTQVRDWQTLLTELARCKITSALVAVRSESALEMLKFQLVDRILASTRGELPSDFIGRDVESPRELYIVADHVDSTATDK